MSQPRRTLHVALIGHHEKDYPRNRSIRDALQAADCTVTECHSTAPFPWRHVILAYKYFRIHRTIDVIFMTEGSHRLVPLMRIWTTLTGKRIVFDPFLSRYNTRVEDRALHSPGSLQAWICKWQDWSSTHSAHGLVFDTHEHRDYFYSRYGLNKPYAIIPVGVDEAIFHPRNDDVAQPAAVVSPHFNVLFYGTYIPLQGVEHILEAARILQDEAPHVRFRLIGKGQTYPAMRVLANQLGLSNVEFLPPALPKDLVEHVAASDVCLGIFGDTLKAHNVVPNKVVQAAAMSAPIITAGTPAIRRYFRDGEEAFLVPPGDSRALAEKIMLLATRPALLPHAARRARGVFERSFSVDATSRILSSFLREPSEGLRHTTY